MPRESGLELMRMVRLIRLKKVPNWNRTSSSSAFPIKPKLIVHYFLKIVSDDLLNIQEKVFRRRMIESEDYFERRYAVT